MELVSQKHAELDAKCFCMSLVTLNYDCLNRSKDVSVYLWIKFQCNQGAGRRVGKRMDLIAL